MDALNENPLMTLAYVGIAAYVLHMYWGDYRADRSGQPNLKAMPGAKGFGFGVAVVGVVGSLLLLAVETGGELALGIADEQSEMLCISSLPLFVRGSSKKGSSVASLWLKTRAGLR